MAITSELDDTAASVLKAVRTKALHTNGSFRLASGKISPYFLDIKAVLTDGSDTLLKVTDLMLRRIPRDTTAVGGLAMGSIPIATEIVSMNNRQSPFHPLHFFWVRPEEKTHGLGGLISGTLESSDHVVIVDDVTTEGNSVMKAVRAVQERGARILKILTIVDREEGAADVFKQSGLEFEALLTRTQILSQ